MSDARQAKTKPAPMTERDRFWLAHHKAQGASGKTAKDYAAEHDLSLHALYQARKRLRTLGHLPAARARRPAAGGGPPSSPPVRFSRVSVVPRESARCRIELRNGIAFEWSGALEPEPVIALLERIARLP